MPHPVPADAGSLKGAPPVARLSRFHGSRLINTSGAMSGSLVVIAA